MMQAINAFWNMLYSLITGVDNLATAFSDVTEVVKINADHFKRTELLEGESKLAALEKRIKAMEAE